MGAMNDTTVMAERPKGPAPSATPPGGSQSERQPNARVGLIWLWILATILGAFAVGDAYLLIAFWPASVGPGALPPASSDVIAFGQTITAVPRETLFFVVVILGGSLGGTIHSLRSLAWYVGSQKLFRSWLLRYCYLPIIGALLALILYIVVRAGFLAGTSVDASSPFGFVALGALAGLFSDQLVLKLKDVFETLLSNAEVGPDAATKPKESEG